MSGASEQANGRASGQKLQSVFLVVLDHSDPASSNAIWGKAGRNNGRGKDEEGEDAVEEGMMEVRCRRRSGRTLLIQTKELFVSQQR